MSRRACLLLLIAALVIPYPVVAQPAFLVEDINQSGITPFVFPGTQLTGLGTILVFAYNDGVHGQELWKSDGTGPGTALLIDLCPGSCSSQPSSLTVFDGLLFFIADDGTHGRELWKSDGTAAGTTLVKDVYPGMGNRERFQLVTPGGLLEADGVLYFAMDDGEHGQELWKTDGTSEGTVLVRDIHPGPQGSDPRPWVAANGLLLLHADDGTHGRAPWVSDGTEAGTTLLADIDLGSVPAPSDAIAAPGGGFLFRSGDSTQGKLWKTDGTEAGTALVKDFGAGGGFGPSGFAILGAAVYFSAGDSLHGRELWRTDGTAAGTTLVKDINPDHASSRPSEITASGGRLFFRAITESAGAELWRSDGTEAGTVMVKDILPGSFSGLSFPQNGITAFNGGVLFLVPVGGLWRSDGTAAGTTLISSDPTAPAVEFYDDSWALVGSLFFFTVFEHSSAGLYSGPPTLWRSDGVSASLIPTNPPAPWSIRSDLLFPTSRLVEQGGRLLFTADQGNEFDALWTSDATSAGTFLLNSGFSFGLTPMGSFTFLALDRFPTRTDGTPAGTQMLSDGLFSGGETAVLGSSVLFFCEQLFSPEPRALCKSDGTPGGTGTVKNLGSDYSISQLTFSGSNVFFIAGILTFDGLLDPKLWKSDGTEAGTMVVRDIWPDGEAFPDRLTDVAGTLFFSAATEGEGRELWKTDGTEAGTVLVKDIRPGASSSIEKDVNWRGASVGGDPGAGFTVAVGGTLFFVASDGISGNELWQSDGTAAGTVLVKDITPGPLGSDPFWLTRVGSRVYFAANNGSHGRELWVSDGTEAGTRMVMDILPGAGSSVPQHLQALGHILLFAATDGVHGLEAWRTDGTALGTRMIQDIAPGAFPSSPAFFTPAGSHVFFAANDTATGYEPWAVPRSAVLSTFGDLSTEFWAWPFIEAVAAAGLTTGCAPGLFCPEASVSRAETAAFLVRGIHGSGFVPPAATGIVFQDVPASYWAASWIEQMFQDGLTTGCAAAPPRFCPDQPLNRAEMAVFLLRAKHGSSYAPPPATGTVFTDVPANYWAASWIEQLAAEGITTGCAPGLYCPDASVTRAQMAAFLTRTFSLPLP
jgi:ELWxxDGT repeat protein